MDEFTRAALWGLIGGFIYAAPKFTACLYACVHSAARCGFCYLEFAVGVLTGAAAASAVAPAILAQDWTWLGRPGPHQLPAIGCAVGYAFHRVGPAILEEAAKMPAKMAANALKRINPE